VPLFSRSKYLYLGRLRSNGSEASFSVAMTSGRAIAKVRCQSRGKDGMRDPRIEKLVAVCWRDV
jgi:hypothetical protein